MKAWFLIEDLVDWQTKGLFVWAVAGWLYRKSCCVGKAAALGKLLF
jgi:hypothetical protein